MSPYTTPTAVNVRGKSRRDPATPDRVALMRPSQNTEDNTHEFARLDRSRQGEHQRVGRQHASNDRTPPRSREADQGRPRSQQPHDPRDDRDQRHEGQGRFEVLRDGPAKAGAHFYEPGSQSERTVSSRWFSPAALSRVR